MPGLFAWRETFLHRGPSLLQIQKSSKIHPVVCSTFATGSQADGYYYFKISRSAKHTKALRLYCLLTLTIFSSASAQNADIRLLRDINVNRNTQLDGFFKGVTDTTVPVAFGVPIVMLGVGLLKKDAPTQRKALVIGAGLVVSSGITYVMKKAINCRKTSARRISIAWIAS